MLTPPVFLLLASLQFAVGALVAACFQSWHLVIFPSLTGPLLGALFLSEESIELPISLRNQTSVFLCSILLLLLLLPAFGFIYTSLRTPRAGDLDLARFAGRHVCVEAQVDSILPQRSSKNVRLICSVKNAGNRFRGRFSVEKCDGATLLFIHRNAPWLDKLSRKARFRCSVRVASLSDFESNGRRGYAVYLQRLGITSLCYLERGGYFSLLPQESSLSLVSRICETFCDFIEVQRSRLIAAHISNLGTEIGSLLAAMVLGERAVGVNEELLTSFRSVGLSHVLAASGFNLTIVTLSTHWVCRTLGLSAIPRNCLSFVMMAVFVAFAGNSSSVVRASLMCALAIGCSSLGRRVHIAGLLGAALFISIIVDPLSVADPGFQLSYTAVSGIIFIVSPVSELLKLSVSRGWLRLVLECLATVFVAQACVLPLQLFYFKQVGMLFLPANLLASLVVTPVTVAGFASSLVVLLCPAGTMISGPILLLATLLDWFASLPLTVLVWAVSLLSSCRWAVLSFPEIGAWVVFLYYLVFILISVRLLKYVQSFQKAQANSRMVAALENRENEKRD